MMIDLRKLKHAVVLADELNYARAARKLSITQSALSRSIASLEEDWGVSLFDRDQTGVRLTPFGINFLSSATQLLRQVDTFGMEVMQLKGGMAGRLSIGVAPALTHTLIPQVLTHLINKSPDLHIDIVTKGGQDLIDDLLKENIEMVLMTNFPLDHRVFPRVEMRPVVKIAVRAFARRRHPLLTSGSAIGLKDIVGYPVLIQRLNDLNLQLFREVFLGLDADQEFRSVTSCDDMSLLKEVASTTDAVLFTAYDAVLKEVRDGTLAELKLQNQAALDGQVVLVTMKGDSLSPLAKAVIEELLDEARNLSEEVTPLPLEVRP